MLIEILEDNFEHSEIIFVNDYSSDNSSMKIKECSKLATSTSITELNMSYFQGRELAMHAGVDLSIGDFVYEFECTYIDYAKDEILKAYYKSLEGFDIVSMSPDKNILKSSKLFYKVFDRFSDMPYKMNSERFRILSRRVINRVTGMNNSIPYRKAVYSHCGLKTVNLIYHVSAEKKSKKYKLSYDEKRYRRKLSIDVLIVFTRLGYKFSICMTAMMILLTLLMILYTVFTYAFRNPVEGWTTTILFFSFAFFGLFGLLTIIIKYLQIILDMVFKRKKYNFESVEKLTK